MEVSRTIISNIFLILSLLAGSIASAQSASPTPTPTTGMVLVGTPAGLSAYDPGTTTSTSTTTGTSPTIYGGYTGAPTGSGCASATSDSTCNSCDGSGLKICNPTSVHPALYLTMTIQTSTTIAQGARLRWKFSDTTAGSYAFDTAPTTFAVNTPMTVQIKWSNLCAVAMNDVNCTASSGFSKTLQVGIDANGDDVLDDKVTLNIVYRYLDGSQTGNANQQVIGTACTGTVSPESSTEGICDYTVQRGDEKVYITDYGASGVDLNTPYSGVKFNRVVMFYAENASDASAVTNLSSSVTINLNNNSPASPSIADPRIRGLQNEVNYCFALGNMDQTGIISYYPPSATLTTASKVCAMPSQVVGLLDDKHCFIATATYGSPMAPEVQTFREFRNKYLLTNSFGQSLVRAYYKFGPEAAEWVSHSSTLKAASLGILWPILMFVKLSLYFGIIPAILMALLATVALAKMITWTLRRRSSLKGAA